MPTRGKGKRGRGMRREGGAHESWNKKGSQKEDEIKDAEEMRVMGARIFSMQTFVPRLHSNKCGESSGVDRVVTKGGSDVSLPVLEASSERVAPAFAGKLSVGIANLLTTFLQTASRMRNFTENASNMAIETLERKGLSSQRGLLRKTQHF
ncbi:hypothetical protein AAG570_011580 [Ranatra chinensis]|uniref:Uncharacterized protein n=1 Tax=Ranatra chinensis TaxID=642074 RepID=A0ABD0Z9E5_9HEMI